jgi:3-methylcrotonyl-CoA carboxylase beta subunit
MPSRGRLITGIGAIAGRDCVVVANDATVKGGTYYPITVTKHLRAQEIAIENRLPASISSIPAALSCRCRISVSGARSFRPHFYNQAPHVGCRHSASRSRARLLHGGGAYIPAMCEQSIIVKGQGTIFLAGRRW